MIKTILIEDELNVREALKKILKIAPTVNIFGKATYIKKAINLIDKKQPDLIFLDIKLEDVSGFDILNKIKNIIFTTAYNQHAIKAFKFSANYLIMSNEDIVPISTRKKSDIINLISK